MICSSVCLFRFIVRSFQRPDSNSIWINPQGQRQEQNARNTQEA
jgi:hypothetical protein